MTYATRPAAYTSSSSLPSIRTRKIVGRVRSLARPPGRGRRLNVPEEIADLWLRRGVIPFFINPQSTPTSRLFYIVPRFQRLIFPIVPWRVSRQSALLPPLSSSFCSPSCILSLALPPSPLSPLYPSFLYTSLLATAAPFHLSPTHPIVSSQSLPGRAVRIVIGKQISMAVLKVSALMEPAIFGPTKIPCREEEVGALSSWRVTNAHGSFYLRKCN